MKVGKEALRVGTTLVHRVGPDFNSTQLSGNAIQWLADADNHVNYAVS